MADVAGKTLVERHDAKAAAERHRAAEGYRTLLLRNANPESGDEETLRQTMQILGRSPADPPGDLAIVEELAACEAAAGELDARQAALHEVQGAANAAIEWRRAEREKVEARIRAKLAGAEAARNAAAGPADEARGAKSRLGGLQDQWAAILTGRPVEELREERLSALRGTPHGACTRGATQAGSVYAVPPPGLPGDENGLQSTSLAGVDDL